MAINEKRLKVKFERVAFISLAYFLSQFPLIFCFNHYFSSTKLMAGKTSQKSSKELYREAAQILGIACEFDEDCRCIECQVSIKSSFI